MNPSLAIGASQAISARADHGPATSELPPSPRKPAPSPEQIRLVQSTWLKVMPIRNAAAQLFYARLFAMDPSLKALFRGDMREQGTKLMNMINAAVKGLSQLERVIPAVQELGRRHAGYGVKEQHYATVGAALLWTLSKGLGVDFTPAAKAAWAAVYDVLATTMQEAAVTAQA